MAVRFTWDPQKDRSNQDKHGVDFREGSSVFADVLSVTFPDPVHSQGEERYVTISVSKRGRVLVTAHLDRDDTIRIISTRPATRSERRFL